MPGLEDVYGNPLADPVIDPAALRDDTAAAPIDLGPPPVSEAWPPPEWNFGQALAEGQQAPATVLQPSEAESQALAAPAVAEGAPVPAPSGFALPPSNLAAAVAAPPPLPEQDYEGLRTAATAEADALAVDEGLGRQEAKRVAALSPEEYALEQNDYANRRDAAIGAKLDENVLAAGENLRQRKEASAVATKRLLQIDGKLQELAATEIEPDRYMQNLGGGRTLAAFVSAGLSGFLDPTGPNSTVELLKSQISQDIEAQKATLVNRRGALADQRSVMNDLLAESGNIYQAAETVRLATYDALERQIKMGFSKFDPKGAYAMRGAELLRQVQAEKLKTKAELEKEMHKRALDESKDKREWFDSKEAARHNRATEAAARAAAAPKPERVYSKEEIATWFGVTDAPGPMTEKQLEGLLEIRNKKAIGISHAKDVDAKNLALSPEERARQFGIGGLKRKDGKPVLARSTDVAAKLSDAKAATDTAAALVDKLLLARDEHGFSSDTMKSPEWRQMQSDYAALQLQVKETAKLGVLAGPDMGIIEKLLGTSDPTEFREIAAGLENARSNIVTQFNAALKANDPEAEKYTPTKLEALQRRERPKADDLKIATSPPASFASTPEETAALVEERALAIANLRGKNPTAEEIAEVRAAIDRDLLADKITPAQAQRLADSVAAAEKKIEKQPERAPKYMGNGRIPLYWAEDEN